ncbi:MAG: hypothetical protein ACU85E_11350 [Gammaproteobacteria bacterium]
MKTFEFTITVLLGLTLFGIQPSEATGFRGHSSGHHFNHGHHRRGNFQGHRRGGHFGYSHSIRHFKPYHRPYQYYRSGKYRAYPYFDYGYGHNSYYYNDYRYSPYRNYGGSGYYR